MCDCVTGLVLSKRSMHDELVKKPSKYLIRPDDGPGLAAHGLPALLAAAFLVGPCRPGLAQYEALDLVPEQAAPTLPAGGATLFLNVRIFDGKNAALSAPSSVLVRDNVIEQISVDPATTAAGADVRVINANGRVLMPGLIDAHWHAFMAATPQMVLMTADPNYLQLLAARQAEATLMRGFTTVRDLGVPSLDLNAPSTKVSPLVRASIRRALLSRKPPGHGDFRSPLSFPARSEAR